MRLGELFAAGLSKVKNGGTHSTVPSRAVDIAPYPVDWADKERFVLLAGFVLGVARANGLCPQVGRGGTGTGIPRSKMKPSGTLGTSN